MNFRVVFSAARGESQISPRLQAAPLFAFACCAISGFEYMRMLICDCALLRLRVCVCVRLFIGVRVQGLAGVSSTSPPGGNQVDGLPPAPVCLRLSVSKAIVIDKR